MTIAFDDLLPIPSDPIKADFRNRLIAVLENEGELLPSANSPRGKLWHLVNTPNSSVEDCAEILQLDSALTSRILRVANSGAYGLQAESVTEALHHLGLKFVREQVFNIVVFKQYSGWILPPEWDFFWLRNIFVARLCERLALTYGATNGGEYLSGLIHDMGWLFLASYFPDEYTRLFASGKLIVKAEMDLLPFDHAEIAAAIAARSLVPARVVCAVRHHHAPLSAFDGDPLVPATREELLPNVILYVSDRLADLCQMDIFSPAGLTMAELAESPEVQWLHRSGEPLDLARVAGEELAKAQEIFQVYFSNRKFN